MPVGQHHPFLPLPHIPEQTEMIPAGVLTIGVGYRILNEAIARDYLDSIGVTRVDDDGTERTYDRQDGGVCIHVFGPWPGRDDLVELFRFDCFDDEPHYHYVYNADGSQDRVFLDPTLEGDPMAWTFDRLRNRMPDVLRKVGAPELAERVDPAAIDAAVPRVRAAIERATSEASRAAALVKPGPAADGSEAA